MKLQVRGAETFVTTGGRPFVPEQPTIVFVHGAGMNRIVWYFVAFRNWRTGFRICWIPQGWPRPYWLDIRWGR